MAKKAKVPSVATRGERALIAGALPGILGIMPGQVRLASREQQPPRPPPAKKRGGKGR
jgi:hypothetical protein